MAFSALSLSTQSGVQGRPYRAVLTGLQAGSTVELTGDGSPGFSFVNGRFSNDSLPYTVSTLVFDEIRPGEGRKQWRFDITAAGAPVQSVATDGTITYSGAGGAPTAKTGTASTSGPVHTVARLLGSSSTLALASGTNSNLTLNATTGVISATAAIAVGQSQTAIVSETAGQLRVDYPVVVTGVSATPTPTPTPVGDLTINTLRRVALPTNALAVPAPTQDASTPAVTTLSAPAANAIVIDPTTTYQTFEGMGVQLQHATRYNLDTLLTAQQADDLLTATFSPSAGNATIVRGYLGDGVFLAKYKPDGAADYYTLTGPLSDREARDPALGWEALLKTHARPLNFDRQMENFGYITKKAFEKNPNIKLFLTVASYPAWMKTNVNNGSPLDNNGFQALGCGGSIRTDMMEIVARYCCEGMAWHFDNDMPVWMFAPQNEPSVEGDKKYTTCLWSAAQLALFWKIIDPLMKLPEYNTGKRKLAQVRRAIGECNSGDIGAEIRSPMLNPDASSIITDACLHNYNAGLDKASTIFDIKPDVRVHMTEWRTLTSGSIKSAHADMWLNMVYEPFLNNFSSSTLFVLALAEDGTPTSNNKLRRGIVWTMLDGSGVKPQPEFYMLTEMGRNVQVGAKRIFTSDVIPTTTVRTVAFKNPDGTTTAVLFNATQSSSRTVQVVDAITGQSTSITLAGGQVGLVKLSQPTAGAVVNAPSGLAAVGSETQVTLSWTNPPGSKGTRILRKTGTGAYEQVTVCEAGRSTYADTSIATGTSYTYMLEAIGNGRSINNPTASATTSGTALPNLPDITLSFNPQPVTGQPTTVTINGRASASTVETLEFLDAPTLTVGSDNTAVWTPMADGATGITPVSSASGYANSPHRSPTIAVTVASAGGTPAPQPFLSATFTAPSGTALPAYTPEIGGPFVKNTAGSVASDFLIGGAGTVYTSGNAARADTSVPTENYTAVLDVTRFGTGTFTVGIMLRSQDASDSGYTVTYNNGNGTWALQKRVNGSGSSGGGATLLSTTTHAITTGNTMRASLVMNGSSLTLIVDGETIGTATDATYATGKLALRYLTQATSGAGANVTSMSAAPNA